MAVVNATEEPHTLQLAVQGRRKGSKGRCWKLVAAGLDARNDVGKLPQVVIRETGFDPRTTRITAAATSIALYEFALAV